VSKEKGVTMQNGRNKYPNRAIDKYALLAMRYNIVMTDVDAAKYCHCEPITLSIYRGLLVKHCGFGFEQLDTGEIRVVRRPDKYEGDVKTKYPAGKSAPLPSFSSGIKGGYMRFASEHDVIPPDDEMQGMLGGSGKGTFSPIRSDMRKIGYVIRENTDKSWRIMARPKGMNQPSMNGYHAQPPMIEMSADDTSSAARNGENADNQTVCNISEQLRMLIELQASTKDALQSLSDSMRIFAKWLES